MNIQRCIRKCDEIDGGVRLAVIKTVKRCLRTVGELDFVVEFDDEVDEEPCLSFAVRRIIHSGLEGVVELPGERRIIKAFKNALK